MGGAGGAANTSATAAGRRTNARGEGEEEAGEIKLLSPQRKVVFSFCLVKIV